jgi:hypothetical protein
VATRRALVAVWPIKLVFWLTVPGIGALIPAMYLAQPFLLLGAAIATSLGLTLFAALLADNLRRAAALPVVAAYGWTALVALLLLGGLGLLLALDYRTASLSDRGAAALGHMILGGFGFMGMLALGFSHVLVPMFALAAAPPKPPSFVAFGLTATAVAIGAAGALAGSAGMLTSAVLLGLGAAALHLWLMHRVLATGMRKRLGLSFVLIRAAWVMLPVTLLVGGASIHGLAGPNGPALFGFMLIGGWLLTFLLGVLQRVLPFLASMHAVRQADGLPPLLSELARSGPLQVHATCHAIALTVMATAIAVDSPVLVRIGGVTGLLGAAAFAWFTGDVIRRLLRR